MRLWSLSPEYLDRQGLLAVWREGLLAQKVLAGKTRGYRNHPQLIRFRKTSDPLAYIGTYLGYIEEEAARCGYHFERKKIILLKKNLKKIKVNDSQLSYEFAHLLQKLKVRNPALYGELKEEREIIPNPLFQVIKGGIADWEKIK